MVEAETIGSLELDLRRHSVVVVCCCARRHAVCQCVRQSAVNDVERIVKLTRKSARRWPAGAGCCFALSSKADGSSLAWRCRASQAS